MLFYFLNIYFATISSVRGGINMFDCKKCQINSVCKDISKGDTLRKRVKNMNDDDNDSPFIADARCVEYRPMPESGCPPNNFMKKG